MPPTRYFVYSAACPKSQKTLLYATTSAFSRSHASFSIRQHNLDTIAADSLMHTNERYNAISEFGELKNKSQLNVLYLKGIHFGPSTPFHCRLIQPRLPCRINAKIKSILRWFSVVTSAEVRAGLTLWAGRTAPAHSTHVLLRSWTRAAVSPNSPARVRPPNDPIGRLSCGLCCSAGS